MKSNRRQFIKGIGWVALASTFFGKIARAVTKAIQKPSVAPRKNWHILNDGPILIEVAPSVSAMEKALRPHREYLKNMSGPYTYHTGVVYQDTFHGLCVVKGTYSRKAKWYIDGEEVKTDA